MVPARLAFVLRRVFRIMGTLALSLGMLAGPRGAQAATGPRCYVNGFVAGGLQDGSSWANAYPQLRTALDDPNCVEFWVATARYLPSGTGVQSASFVINSGEHLYGGFAGTETQRTQRDPTVHPTILSGDVDNNDGISVAPTTDYIQGSNSYHVVRVDGSTTDVNSTTVLDGFIITAGKANGSGADKGGGLYCEGSGAGHQCSPTLANLTFSGNWAWYGGGMYNNGSSGGESSPVLTNVIFTGNKGQDNTGGMYNDAQSAGRSSPELTDVTFSGNQGNNSVGGMLNNAGPGGTSSPILRRVTFSSNSALFGGGMMNSAIGSDSISSPSLTNVTFYGNTAGNSGAAMYNTESDGRLEPSLVNVTFKNNAATGYGGGMSNSASGGVCAPLLVNVIIWGNTAGFDDPSIRNSDCGPSISHSVIQGSGGSGGGWDGTMGADLGGNLDADPILGGLGNNGGKTQTVPLQPGSSAMDTGEDGIYALCPATDQRGLKRPQGPACDIGAFELPQKRVRFKSQGTKDGTVVESAALNGTGGSHDTPGLTFSLGDTSKDQQSVAILSFKTSSLPDSAALLSVGLRIKKAGKVGSNPFLSLGLIEVDIHNAFFGSKSSLQDSDFGAGATLGNAMMIANGSTKGWYSTSLNLVNFNQINKTGLTQLRLRFATDDDNNLTASLLKFYSGDAGAATRPQLVVVYYVP